MKRQLNRESSGRFGPRIAVWSVVALVALPLLSAPRAHAQSGGPGADAGVVTSIDDAKLDIRVGSHTTTYDTTEQTQWLNKRGQRIDPGDVVGKMVEVRFRWITGGSEALSVRLTGNGSSSSESSKSSRSQSRSEGGSPFSGKWRNPETGDKLTISVNGENVVMDYSQGTPDEGTIRGNLIYYQGLLREEGKLLKTSGSIALSSDGGSVIIHQTVFKSNGSVLKSETMTYHRMR